jgi:hypothetical protein
MVIQRMVFTKAQDFASLAVEANTIAGRMVSSSTH